MSGDSLDREIRLAIVMTGGVSLAVWMGGACSEIYQAVCGTGLYGRLLKATKSTLTIDVITGASAGGLNGAFLSLAMTRQADPKVFDDLARLWLEVGSLRKLSRDPLKPNPPSLLKGDDFFLTELHKALGRFADASPRAGAAPEPGPLDLVMTASVLQPRTLPFFDDFGSKIVEPDHRAQFHFDTKTLRASAATQSTLVAQLARAARTSASFPGAFEASWLQKGAAHGHPDMEAVSNLTASGWAVDGGVLQNEPVGPAVDLVLERPAGQEIRRVMMYINPDPGGTADEAVGADLSVAPTMSQIVAKSLVSMPRTESIAADLQKIRSNNNRLLDQRHGREALLVGYRVKDSPSITADTPITLRRVDVIELARHAYPVWLRRRAVLAADSYVRAFLAAGSGRTRQDKVHPKAAPGCNWDLFESALQTARLRLGWFDSELPLADATELAAWKPVPDADGHLDTTPPNVLDGSTYWRFGLEPLEYMCSVILDLLRRAYLLLPCTGGASLDLRQELDHARQALHDQRRKIGAIRTATNDYWLAALGHLDDPSTDDIVNPQRYLSNLAVKAYLHWPEAPHPTSLDAPPTDRPSPLATLLADHATAEAPAATAGTAWSAMHLAVRQLEMTIANDLAGLLRAAAPVLRQAADVHSDHYGSFDRASDDEDILTLSEGDLLVGMVDAITTQRGRARTTPQTVQYLLAMYVLQSLSDEHFNEREARIDFIQLSADGANGIDPSRQEPAEKLAGLQLSHFGAFLKRSWRANDWMWGSLDATRRIVAIILEPRRLRQCFRSSDEAIRAITDIFSEDVVREHNPGVPTTTADLATVKKLWDDAVAGDGERSIGDELAFLDRPSGSPIPPYLTFTVETVATIIQYPIARRELVKVADAVHVSIEHDGAAQSSEARAFQKAMFPYLELPPLRSADGRRSDHLPLAVVPDLVANCKVGQERLAGESGSDELTAVAATLAAVAGNVATSRASGFSVLRHPLKAMRFATTGLFLLAESALKGTKSGFAATTLLLGVAAATAGLAIAGVDVPPSIWVIASLMLAMWLAVTANIAGGRRTVARMAPVIAAVLLVGISSIDAKQATAAFTGQFAGGKVALRLASSVVLLALAIGNAIGLKIWWNDQRPAVRAKQKHRWFYLFACLIAIPVTWPLWHWATSTDSTSDRRLLVNVFGNFNSVRWFIALVVLPAGIVFYEYLRSQQRKSQIYFLQKGPQDRPPMVIDLRKETAPTAAGTTADSNPAMADLPVVRPSDVPTSVE
ncbi:MAG: patatin-like protein [Acidimicrobiia bacterium]